MWKQNEYPLLIAALAIILFGVFVIISFKHNLILKEKIARLEHYNGRVTETAGLPMMLTYKGGFYMVEKWPVANHTFNNVSAVPRRKPEID